MCVGGCFFHPHTERQITKWKAFFSVHISCLMLKTSAQLENRTREKERKSEGINVRNRFIFFCLRRLRWGVFVGWADLIIRGLWLWRIFCLDTVQLG